MVKRALLPLLLVALPVTYSLRSSAQQPAAPKPKASASAPPIDTGLLDSPPPTAKKPAPPTSVVPLPPPVPTPVAIPIPPIASTAPPTAPKPAPAAAAAAASATNTLGLRAALHHAPLSVAKPHEAIDIAADVDSPHLIKKIVLVYKHGAATDEVAFLRGGEGYVARIPGEHVNPPGLSYAIEIETVDGKTVSAFATRADPHQVQVPDDLDDERERILLERVGGRRSVVAGSFDYVYYGRSRSGEGSDVRDQYWRAEAAYLYRPLRHIFQFGFRLGMVRGQSPDGGPDGTKVGLNYGSPTAMARLHDLFHVEAFLYTSVNQEGFSPGIGGAMHIGDPLGSKLVLAAETIKTFGNRGWVRLDIVRRWFRVSPVVEVGNIPSARTGVRLYTELAFDLGQGFHLAVRGGYQARDFNSGGPGGGLSFGYAF